MWRIRRSLAQLKNLLLRRRAEGELTREVAAHLALLEEEHQRRGLSPELARLAARKAFGGVDVAKEIPAQGSIAAIPRQLGFGGDLHALGIGVVRGDNGLSVLLVLALRHQGEVSSADDVLPLVDNPLCGFAAICHRVPLGHG